MLKHTYRRIIRMNWLCNPTGKPGAFRGVDWLVERNNLYTKVEVPFLNSKLGISIDDEIQVIFAGTGSSRNITHIINESPLIELYRSCHVTVENGFHLKHLTIRHAPPNMTNTIAKLRREIENSSPHKFTAGRRVDFVVEDKISAAAHGWQNQRMKATDNENGVRGVEQDDLMDD